MEEKKSTIEVIKENHNKISSVIFIKNKNYIYKDDYTAKILVHVTFFKNVNGILNDGIKPGKSKGIMKSKENNFMYLLTSHYTRKDIDVKNAIILVDPKKLSLNHEAQWGVDVEHVNIKEDVPKENIIGFIKNATVKDINI